MIGPYATPQAFRDALEARLRNASQAQGTDLQRLQRRVAFERLLARLFVQVDPPWLLKGGYALELRLENRARSTMDLDISVPDPNHPQLLATAGEGISGVQAVYEYLQQSAECDLNDGFEFLVSRPREVQTGAPGGGIRCSIETRVAGRTFVQFHLDVGLGDAILGQPDWVKSNALLSFAGMPAERIALLPMAQQFAEKIHAYTFPRRDRDNTRVKDLVDLVLLLACGLLEPDHVKRALRATFETRDTHLLPPRLPMPPEGWADSYASWAQELQLPVLTLPEAYAYLDTCWQDWELGQEAHEGAL